MGINGRPKRLAHMQAAIPQFSAFVDITICKQAKNNSLGGAAVFGLFSLMIHLSVAGLHKLICTFHDLL